MVLFWHQVFATGQSKIDHWHELINQADMFREHGHGQLPRSAGRAGQEPGHDLLAGQLRQPRAMRSTKTGAGSCWSCSAWAWVWRAPTTRRRTSGRPPGPSPAGRSRYTPPRGYYNRWDWEFEYLEEDHDDGEKTFLGHTGNFNGEDIIDIIVQQPACHRFIARHLYNFFVADEPQVPAWQTTPPRDPEAIDTHRHGLRGIALRHALDVAGAVPLRLLQERPLCQDQESR